jgi:16S rRNA (cytosine967-C5)-methyltransferase
LTVPAVPTDEPPTREDFLRERARRPGALRTRIVDLSAAAARDWYRASETISDVLRSARELAAPERRFVADAAHELVRFRRLLAFLSAQPDALAASPSLDPEALLDAWLRAVANPAFVQERLADIADPVERRATEISWPTWLFQRVAAAYGMDPTVELGRAMNHRAPLWVRSNRLRTTREALAERLQIEGIQSTPSTRAPDGLQLHTRQNIYGLEAFREGLLEMQDEGSQLIAELVAPPPRSTVVDACAGAGGKTLALGARLANQGRIVALDISRPKLEELRRRARRAGLTNVQAVPVPSERASDAMPRVSPAARVLVDAPCSGLGVLRRNPETRWRLRPAEVDELPAKQRAILGRYAQLVEPGGRLIYATCSILPEENEAVVAAFRTEHPEFEPVSAKEILGREAALSMGDGEVLRVLPHVHDSDGFFAAVLRRRR